MSKYTARLSLCAMGLVALFCVNAFATVLEPDPREFCRAEGWFDSGITDFYCGEGSRMIYADHNGRCTKDVQKISCIKCVSENSNLCVDQKKIRDGKPIIQDGSQYPLPEFQPAPSGPKTGR